jgi:hypothetical protein
MVSIQRLVAGKGLQILSPGLAVRIGSIGGLADTPLYLYLHILGGVFIVCLSHNAPLDYETRSPARERFPPCRRVPA